MLDEIQEERSQQTAGTFQLRNQVTKGGLFRKKEPKALSLLHSWARLPIRKATHLNGSFSSFGLMQRT